MSNEAVYEAKSAEHLIEELTPVNRQFVKILIQAFVKINETRSGSLAGPDPAITK